MKNGKKMSYQLFPRFSYKICIHFADNFHPFIPLCFSFFWNLRHFYIKSQLKRCKSFCKRSMEHWICNAVPPSNNGTNKETIYIFLTGWWRLKNKLVCSSARRRKFSSYSNFPTVTFCGCGNRTLLSINCGTPSMNWMVQEVL